MSENTDAAPSARPSRLSQSVLNRARDMVRAIGAPTQIISIPGGDDRVTQRHARAVIDLCLRVGEAMLATGASSADVVAMILRLSTSYGVAGVHVDIAFTSITVSVHRGLNEDPITVMRIIRVRTTDYTRLQDVYRLVDEITSASEPLEVDVARKYLGRILTQPHPYRRWVVTLGKAVLAGGVAVMFNVSFVLVLAAALSAVFADLVTRRLGRWGISAFFSQMAAAAITTAVAVLMFWLRSVGLELPGANHPTVIVISGIIMLLSGVGLTTSARDAIDGSYVTATARGLEVVMLTLGLAIGISLTLGLALRMGVSVTIGTSLGSEIGLLPGVVGAALIGAGFALTSYVRLALAPLMALVAGLVFALYFVLLPLAPQPGVAPGVAGVAAGIIAFVTYRWLKIPESGMAMAGVIGLIPGLAVYRALFALMDSQFGIMAALPELVVALATGLGLAAGTSIGGSIARRTFGLDRAAELALRNSRAQR